MKHKRLFLFLIMLTSGIKCFSQNKSDTIEIVKTFFGSTFYFDGEVLPPRGIRDLVKIIPVANSEIKIAKRNHIISSVLRITGGTLFAYSFLQFSGAGTLIAKPNGPQQLLQQD